MKTTLAQKDAIHLDRGDPYDNTPRLISREGIRAIKAGKTHYADPLGTITLRESISKSLQEIGLQFNPQDEIFVTAGASPAIFATLIALTVPGDRVLVPNPGWPTYLQMINSLGRNADRYPMPFGKNGISLDDWHNGLRSQISPNTRLIIVNSPHNPTGKVLDVEWLSSLASLCDEFPHITILSDEPYHRIIFDNLSHVSPASIPELKLRTIVIHTLSKTYAMAGWRVGYIAAPSKLAERIRTIHLSMNCSASSISQEAATWALTNGGKIVDGYRLRYEKNRDYLVSQLNKVGYFQCPSPQGSLYLFPDVSEFGIESKALSSMLERSEGIYLYPGSIYGTAGEYHVRICFATTHEVLAEFLKRLHNFVKTWKRNDN